MLVGVGGGDAAVEFTFVGLAGDDDGAAFAVCFWLDVEAEVSLALGGVGAVALETMVREDGANVAIEFDRWC